MTSDVATNVRGKDVSDRVHPGMKAARDARTLGRARTNVDAARGQFLARDMVDEKTRLLATVVARAALGGQAKPQLKANIASARAVGASREDISEIIFQMALSGEMPAMINALNAAMEVFEGEND